MGYILGGIIGIFVLLTGADGLGVADVHLPCPSAFSWWNICVRNLAIIPVNTPEVHVSKEVVVVEPTAYVPRDTPEPKRSDTSKGSQYGEAFDLIVRPGEEPVEGVARVSEEEVLIVVGYFEVDGVRYDDSLRVFDGDSELLMIDGSSSIMPKGHKAHTRFCDYLTEGPSDVEPVEWVQYCDSSSIDSDEVSTDGILVEVGQSAWGYEFRSTDGQIVLCTGGDCYDSSASEAMLVIDGEVDIAPDDPNVVNLQEWDAS